MPNATNFGRIISRTAAVWAGLILLTGCQPSGPKALLLGARAIHEGEYPKALKYLDRAAELIPAQPQVWNHLGLALHHSNEPQKAAEAYTRALRIDPKLPAAHFNLGMLYLEQGKVNEAIGELGTFVTLQPTNATGLSKLGTALVRARRLDEGERAANQALRLNPKEAEAHNTLGLIHVQRKRARDAMLEFNAALEDRPGYPAALLNQAIVAQLYFGRSEMALDRYRAYLNSDPNGRYRPEVAGMVARLEEAARNATVALAPANRFNLPAVTNAVAAVEPRSRTNAPATNALLALLPKTNAAAQTPAPLVTNVAIARTNPPPLRIEKTNEVKVAQASPSPLPPPAQETTSKMPEETVAPVQVEVVREPELKAPRDVSPPAENELKVAAARPAETPPPLIIPRKNRDPEPKHGFLERANPMRWFRSAEPEKASPPPRTAPQATSTAQVEKQAEPAPAATLRVPPQFERYSYQKSPPVKGDRAQAEKLFVQAARAHQEQRLGTAIELYRQAVAADPAYFDAQFNLGLAAYQLKDLPLALRANENARTLQPNSVDARYHFAIALRDANYPVDAANEFRALLAESPDEVRAHLALGTLYAQVLDEPALARRHYNRLLELAPNYPDAPAIRQWLANHR